MAYRSHNIGNAVGSSWRSKKNKNKAIPCFCWLLFSYMVNSISIAKDWQIPCAEDIACASTYSYYIVFKNILLCVRTASCFANQIFYVFLMSAWCLTIMPRQVCMSYTLHFTWIRHRGGQQKIEWKKMSQTKSSPRLWRSPYSNQWWSWNFHLSYWRRIRKPLGKLCAQSSNASIRCAEYNSILTSP